MAQPHARARFGQYRAVEVNGEIPPVARLLTEFPPRKLQTEQGPLTQGLPVRLQLHRQAAYGELDLGDEGRVWPSDEALGRWRSIAHDGAAQIVYE